MGREVKHGVTVFSVKRHRDPEGAVKDEGDGMGMRLRCGREAGTVWRAAGALRCMALQSSPSHTPSSPPPPTNASRRAWEGAVAVGVGGAIQRRSPPERAPHLGRAPTPCRQAPTVRPSRHRLFPTPLTLRRGEVGARRRRSGGAWWGRGRRHKDAFEVRAGVGDCVASPRAFRGVNRQLRMGEIVGEWK